MLDIMLGICSWEPASKKDMNSKKNPNNKIIAQQEVSKIFAAGRGQEDRMDLHIQFIYYPKINWKPGLEVQMGCPAVEGWARVVQNIP